MSVEASQAFAVRYTGRGYVVADAVPGVSYMLGHFHSDVGDGHMSPGKIVDGALERKIRFVAVTDHDNIGGSVQVAEYISNHGYGADIQAVLGSEITTRERGHEGHLLAFGIQGNIARDQSLQETVDKIHERGGVAVIPHMDVPNADSIRREDAQILWSNSSRPADGIEIVNGSVKTFYRNPVTRRWWFPEDYNAKADDFLMQMREGGAIVARFGGPDNHMGRLGRTVLTGIHGENPVKAIEAGDTSVVVDSGGVGLVEVGRELRVRKPVKKQRRE